MLLITPVPPTEYLGIATCRTYEGEVRTLIIRVLAHSTREARRLIEKEVYDDYGITLAMVEDSYNQENGYIDDLPIYIEEMNLYEIDKLEEEIDVLADPFVLAAQGQPATCLPR